MNYVDTKELDARTSSCGCNSSGAMCQYHQGLEDGYIKGISEKTPEEDIVFRLLYMAGGLFLGILTALISIAP